MTIIATFDTIPLAIVLTLIPLLRIRLQRIGRKNQPIYRVVVAEHARAVKGKFIEILGSYDASMTPKRFTLNKTRFQAWVEKGAQATPRVVYLLDQASKAAK